MKKIGDGLTQWEYDLTTILLLRLLRHSVSESTSRVIKPAENLLMRLYRTFNVPNIEVMRVFDILAVTRTVGGISYYKERKARSRDKEVLVINFGQLEQYESGGELEEYASFNGDPVIGGRWVQNVEEALLFILGHELAHFIVAKTSWGDQSVKPHGDEFKQVYEVIRRYSVNPILDEFAQEHRDHLSERYRARLTKKIHALKKMAEDETSNENEAERALVQLHALLAKHGLDDAKAATADTMHVIERMVPVIQRDNYKPILHIFGYVAQFCGVETVVHRGGLQSIGAGPRQRRRIVHQYVTYFGSPPDVEMAVFLSELITRTLYIYSDKYQLSDEYQQERSNGHHPRTLIFSFRRAFIGRINRRLRKSRETLENEWAQSGVSQRELMVLKDAKLRELFRKKYPRLAPGPSRDSDARFVDSALSAGRSAADKVNLNRPINGHRSLALPKGNP